MKKINSIVAAFLCMMLFYTAKAQNPAIDYFEGKWNVLIKNTPNGDVKLVFALDKKDTTLTGVIVDTAGAEVSKIDSAIFNGPQLTVYFFAYGYDLNLMLNKKDDDHVAGSLNNMFDAEGERLKKK